ncbi:deaminase [Lujinxingia litoralis]|uniref:Deaminase n=1 Tax=Lujinxingia litoralis TaxID=2211119 RepID=A0A328CAH5_9DELT|nr:dihydrofolate reductase family protein [Lujinxingia litoralis]RAL25132.1 deaminase [Lujinxingia litoralis]
MNLLVCSTQESSMNFVYCGVSLDGFMAGPEDDLSFLEAAGDTDRREGRSVSYEDILARTGALLIGRRTYDVVRGFGGEWPYAGTPVVVATTRPLEPPSSEVVSASGSIEELLEEAASVAGEGDVYVDGGSIITQALGAGLIDELILTVVPVFLGKGVALYQGEDYAHFDVEVLGGMGEATQLRLTPRR